MKNQDQLKILIDPTPEISEKIKKLADLQRRSVKNMTEFLVEKGLEGFKEDLKK